MFLLKGTTKVCLFKNDLSSKYAHKTEYIKIGDMIYLRLINTELSLQSASHNSHKNNNGKVGRKYAKFEQCL